MKIIYIESTPNNAHNNSDSRALLYNEAGIRMLADSALLVKGRPFFIPDLEGPCVGRMVWGIRLNRLGKHIAERYAARYYDKITMGLCFVAEGCRKRLLEQGAASDAVARNFDGAICLGSWTELPEAENLELKIQAAGMTLQDRIEQWRKTADEAIVAVSRHQTMRQGDLLLFETEVHIEVSENTHMTCELQKNRILDFNIK